MKEYSFLSANDNEWNYLINNSVKAVFLLINHF